LSFSLRFFPGLGGTAADGAFLVPLGCPLLLGHCSPFSSFEAGARECAILDHKKLEEVWVGYSMGGRFLLAAAKERAAAGLQVPPMILLSTGLGEVGSEQAEIRRAADGAWAEMAETVSPDLFWQKWYQQPVFSSWGDLPPERRAEWLRGRAPLSLVARQLRQWGPGNHESLRPKLEELLSLGVPALYIVGEKDEKYRSIAFELRSLGATTFVIPGVSHLLPLEAPAELVLVIKEFIEERYHGKKY
jgi:2-succinyl-6-hydroxy-2,4-cyclohexadiene-1-carboxylate synthase